MSVVLSNRANGSSKTNGYFRIGTVVLNIPPSNIITDKIVNNNRKQTIRGKNEMFTKTGQSRWDATITWIAVKDSVASNQWEEWENVRTILSMFKSAPFVEVENAHLRQIFAEQNPQMAASRLSFGLRQMKVETHPDIVDGVIVTLTMTYFNYHPYSIDFGYIGTGNASTDAYKCPLFTAYLDTWKSNNLINKDQTFHVSDWKNQSVGTMEFQWKKYKAVIAPPLPPASNILTAANTVNAVNSIGTTNPSTSSNNSSAIQLISKYEGLRLTAYKDIIGVWTIGYGHTSGVTQGQVITKQQALAFLSTDIGTATSFINKVVTVPLNQNQFNALTSLVFNIGVGNFQKSSILTNINANNFPAAANAFLLYDKAKGQTVPALLTRRQEEKALFLSGSAPILPPTAFASLPTEVLSAALQQVSPNIAQLIADGWIFDYLTNDTAYFYMEELVELTGGQTGGSTFASGLFPTQISVLFVNNLAQIPLANYQYPTYQHIGPASSLISIQMTSLGAIDATTEEPIHQELSELTSMVHTLEEQYMSLKTHFYRFKSIHGMQAVFVRNQVLNMLGIFGILPEQVSTEIIPDSANMVQAGFISHHYENLYEDINPYKINGITGSYVNTLQNIVSSNSLSSLSSNEQSQLTKVMQFQTNLNNSDANALGNWILDAASSSNNGNFIGNLTGNPTITLTPAQINVLTFGATNTNKYPGLASRVTAMSSSNTMTYVDYLALNNLLANSSAPGNAFTSLINSQFANANDINSQVTSIASSVNTQISNAPTVIQGLYPQILKYAINADPVLQSQVQKLVNSPTYKQQFQAGVSSANPSDANPGHGAYKDLGLPDSVSGLDMNPAMYFTDYQTQYRNLISQGLSGATNTITATSNAVGSSSTSQSIVPFNVTTGVPTDPSTLMKMIHIPGYSMREAFPTFKLFFLEDSNSGIYYAFDQFYNYSSVIEMEIIRNYDKPATSVFRLTNLSNILNHKIYDNTLVGKYEKSLDKFTVEDVENDINNNPNVSQTASVNPLTGTITGWDGREGWDPSNPKLIPLKYFPLQTGTKIQIRFGFDNDPDNLTPVFNGIVTEIEEGEIGELIITAQSFLVEIATVSGVSATNTNSWFGIDAFLNHSGVGPAFGGFGLFTDAGDAQSVIRNLLKNPSAKHFGHWILNGAAPDNLLKGYNSWQELTGSVLSDLGFTNAAAIVNSAYDRSGENIMVNNYVDFNGNVNAGRGNRSFNDQAGQAQLLAPFRYYIDNRLDMSLWEMIQDVARRYPEYLLLEKWYGFPYEADATMVFGNPLDWYFTRPSLIGDDEAIRNADSNGQLFQQWWSTQGQAALNNVISTFNLNSFFTNTAGLNGKVDISQAGTSYAAFVNVCDALVQRNVQHLDIFLSDIGITNQQGATLANIQNAVTQVKVSYQAFVAQNSGNNNSGQSNADRIKPVRKYHFIDQQSIVHNGIKLNDKIYNAIKITGKDGKKVSVKSANSNIPAHYLRVIDVTSRINDPDRNVLEPGLENLVSQSFLKEEVGKMYRGELILRGIPEIEPMDVLITLDPSTGIVGPIEVDQVVHSFTQEMGFITIIKPRCLVVVNESAGASIARGFGLTMASVINTFLGKNVNAQITSQSVLSASNSAGSPPALETGPLSGLANLLAASAFFYIVDSKVNTNLLTLQPLSRFGKPWIGGLQGFDLTGIKGNFSASFQTWLADEVFPLVDLYKAANGISTDPS